MTLPDFTEFLAQLDLDELRRRVTVARYGKADFVTIPSVTSPDFPASVVAYVQAQVQEAEQENLQMLQMYHEWLQEQLEAL